MIYNCLAVRLLIDLVDQNWNSEPAETMCMHMYGTPIGFLIPSQLFFQLVNCMSFLRNSDLKIDNFSYFEFCEPNFFQKIRTRALRWLSHSNAD